MITRPLPSHWFSLILFCALLTGGCVSIPVTGESPVTVQSYDLPDSLDFKTVIQSVERAFTQTLATTPWTIEGSVLSPLPDRPSSFTVEERRVHLERLGIVTIHEVGCPGSLATVHAWVADHSESSVPHRYTGCIQLYAGAYRVQLIDSRLVLKSSRGLTGSAETGPKPHPNLLPRLAQAFLEQVAEAREVTNAQIPESVPSDRPTNEKASIGPDPSARERAPSFPAMSEKSAGSSFTRGQGREVVTTSPLACFAPRHEAAAVRTQQGGGTVIQVLDQSSLMAVAEPIDAAYFRVKTTEGLAGWVNRSDVRRLPCPIG
jgi:hypothetical protein